MSWTKLQFIQQAFEEIGLAHYVFDLTPEQLQSALRRMDSMMAGWNIGGVRVGYPLPGSPSASDLNADTGVPDYANEAIYSNLALRLAPSFGKSLSPQTVSNAALSYAAMVDQCVQPTPERQLGSLLPYGAGNKPWRQSGGAFYPPPDDPVDAGDDGELTLE
jgi:P22 tail accessory factor